jgi:hypothetical protein
VQLLLPRVPSEFRKLPPDLPSMRCLVSRCRSMLI